MIESETPFSHHFSQLSIFADMSNLTVLVTGGAGFIGSHVAKSLLAEGHHVIVVDDLSGGFVENIPEGVLFHEGSITNHEWINALFEEYSFDYVYHLAAYAAEGLSPFIRRFNYTNNVIGSTNLINASILNNVKCFVFTSSIAVYGDQPLPYTENQTPLPKDPYGIAKYTVEMDLKNAKEQFGLDSIIFRPHNVYGVGQNIGDPYRNVVGIFMNQLMNGLPLSVFGDGTQTRAFTHVSDVVEYMVRAISIPESYNRAFNIGADNYLSVNELADLIGEAMEQSVQLNYQPARHEMVHAFADHSLFKTVFQPKPFYDIRQGLSEMAIWAKEVGPRKSDPFTQIEIEEGLPDSWKKLMQ